MNPNDKAAWVENHGDEAAFVSEYGKKLKVILNPAKLAEPDGQYEADLLNYGHFVPADLKVQRTPFNTAERFGIHPQLCVTLNVLDYVRYSGKYGNRFIVYFWLLHPGNPHNGVYGASIRKLAEDIVANRRMIHAYQTRDGSDGNKTHSYALDVSKLGRCG